MTVYNKSVFIVFSIYMYLDSFLLSTPGGWLNSVHMGHGTGQTDVKSVKTKEVGAGGRPLPSPYFNNSRVH